MEIAILAYGSLVWDPERLAPHIRLPWAMGGGPALPMEFSRISPKRLMGLVLCLDPGQGADCPTHAIASRRASLDAAIADLALRERAPAERIGHVCLRSGARHTRLPEVAERVADWCAATGRDAAIWTDLDPNFAATAGAPFRHDTAEAWLRGLTGPSRDEAVRYITLAPAASDTALRRHLRTRPWWQAEVARLMLSEPV
ncbi:hypothetical protein [Oceanicella sp. SM1341]|uniref:hypothetical protein n=1 Tax=Oceanicella sp. SM1341 TaxID=1548889 RepID=UPI000E47FF37|nr:hypothetical protein [Oceanicella sp. SM1341]